MKRQLLSSAVSACAAVALFTLPHTASAQFPTSMVATPFPNLGGVSSHGVAVDSNGIVWYVPVGASLVRQDPSFAPGDPAGIQILALPHPAVNNAIDNQDNVWISCSDGFVTKYDPIGGVFTNYGPVGPCGFLDHIHFHSDGMVYTTCLDGHHIIRVDPGPGTITIFPVPTVASATAGITGDFTGDLWSIERSAHNVVRAEPGLMVPNTSLGITEFPIPNSPYAPETVKGCLERIWFTGLNAGANGPRLSYIDINTLVITQFDVDPGASGGTYGLVVDGNGNPFATHPTAPKIYGLDISTNTVTVFPTPTVPHHVALSPTAGDLWYTDFGARITRLVPDVPLEATCEPTQPPAGGDLDIKPGSCPNSFNRNSNGFLPVALVGTANFDVSQVVLGSLQLCRKDGVGGCVAPHQGPPGPNTTIADVATPFSGAEQCDCHTLTGDGIPDLMMHFKSQPLVAALQLNSLPPGALVSLTLSGTLQDGSTFEVDDCIRLVPPGTPPGLVLVSANLPGLWVETIPLDDQLDGGGFTPFSRSYGQGTLMTITVPLVPPGRPDWVLHSWWINGVHIPGSGSTAQMDLVVGGETQVISLLYHPRLVPSPVPATPDRALQGSGQAAE